MDCSYTCNRYPELRRPQMQMPNADMGQGCNCGCNSGGGNNTRPMPAPAMVPQPRRVDSSYPVTLPSFPGAMPCSPCAFCPNTKPGGMELYPIGIGYVPWQQWQQTYSLDMAMDRGTIFPELDLPFVMGRCKP